MTGEALEQPLVTVVTPAYQAGERLQRCLDNVARQSYPRIEHVVVDGGSTDGSVEVLRASQGVRWVSEADRGQSHAINKGFAMARGDLIGWLNADDLLAEGTVERVVDTFRRRPDVGWVYGTVRLTGTVATVDARPPRRLEPKHFYRGTPVPQPGSFFARWALERVGDLAEDLHYAMDLDLWCRFLNSGVQSARMPSVAAIFEVHADSKSGAVPHARFVADQARALHRNGLLEAAAVTCGRSALLEVWDEGKAQKDFIDVAVRRASVCGHDHDRRLVEVGARVEAALLRAKAGSAGSLLTLCAPALWRHDACRQRVTAAALVTLSRAAIRAYGRLGSLAGRY